MEEKLAVPAAPVVAESEAATIAATSVAGDDKGSTADERSEVEVAPAAGLADSEKKTELERQATATSKAGQSLRATNTRDDGTEYPSGMKLNLIVLALCLSVFLMALGK